MTTIETMCNYIIGCLTTITNQIKYLLGIQNDEGYQLIEPSHTQTPSSVSIRGDDSADQTIIRKNNDYSGSPKTNSSLIAVNDMQQQNNQSSIKDSSKINKSDSKKLGAKSIDKNINSMTRSTSDASKTETIIPPKPLSDIKSVSNSSGFSSNIDLDAQTKEPIDVSKINLFKMSYDSKTELNEKSERVSSKIEIPVESKKIAPKDETILESNKTVLPKMETSIEPKKIASKVETPLELNKTVLPKMETSIEPSKKFASKVETTLESNKTVLPKMETSIEPKKIASKVETPPELNKTVLPKMETSIDPKIFTPRVETPLELNKTVLPKMETSIEPKKFASKVETTLESNKTTVQKTEASLEPSAVPKVIKKFPKTFEPKSESLDQSQQGKPIQENDDKQKIPASSGLAKKREGVGLNKSASEKISKLAGNLGKINLFPPGAGGKPPFPKTRPISEASEPKEEEAEAPNVATMTKILKGRVKSMNKQRRPPSMSFLKNTLGSPDKNGFIPSDATNDSSSNKESDPSTESNLVEKSDTSDNSSKISGNITGRSTESLEKPINEDDKTAITPNPSLEGSTEKINEIQPSENIMQKETKIEEKIKESIEPKTLESNNKIDPQTSTPKNMALTSSMQSLTREDNDPADMVFESALDVSGNKSYSPSDGTNVTTNQQFMTVVGENFLSAQDLISQTSGNTK